MTLKYALPVAIMLAALGACTGSQDVATSQGAEKTRLEIDQAFGATDPATLSAVYKDKGHQGRGFTIIRRYSETPSPNTFGSVVPESFARALVLDVGIEMQMVEDFPIYRFALRPQKVATSAVREWPSHLLLRRIGPDGQERRLAARLPQERQLDAEGFIWTDWTYCADCFNLRAIDDASEENKAFAFSLLNEAQAAANARNGAPSPYAGMTLFLGQPGVGILQGRDAFEMAPRASAIVLRAAGGRIKVGPAVSSYGALASEFSAKMSPAGAVQSACGSYQPQQSIVGSPAQTLSEETARFQAWEACADMTIAGFDVPARRSDIEEYASQEASVARAESIASAVRVVPQSVEAELNQARAMGRSAYEAFQARTGDLEAMGRQAGGMKLEAGLRRDVVVAPGAFKLGGDLEDGLPEDMRPKAAVEPNTGPPLQKVLYVTRLLTGGADMSVGPGGPACFDDIPCEIGKIEALIEVKSYCDAPGGVTQAAPGYGLVVQRYQPRTRDEEIRLSEKMVGIFAIADNDQGSLEAATVAMRMENLPGTAHRRFFRTYMDLWPVSTQQMGCTDNFRDTARQKTNANL